jgi:hypothetical protein
MFRYRQNFVLQQSMLANKIGAHLVPKMVLKLVHPEFQPSYIPTL